MEQNDTITFSLSATEAGVLICPECGKKLLIPDVETYRTCPYCEHKFQNNQKFQDFLDSLAVHAWENVECADPIIVHITDDEPKTENSNN